MLYHVRIHAESREYDTIYNWVTSKGSHWIISEEEGIRSHYHIVVETTETDATIRNQLKKLGFIGNKAFSVSKQRKEVYQLYSYVIKEGVYKCGEGVNKTELEKAIKDNEVRKEVKNKRSQWQEIMEYVLEPCETPSKFEILDRIVEYYQKHNQLIRRNMVQAIYDTIMVKLSQDHPNKYENPIYNMIR